MKKSFLFLIIILSCITHVKAYDFEVDGIYYNIISNDSLTCEVTSKNPGYYSGRYTADITVPSHVSYEGNTYTVVRLGDFCFYYSETCESITIPNTVTSIGNQAFRNCKKLSNIHLPENLNIIGSYAFRRCGLKSIVIPNSVTSIGVGAFFECTILEEVIIGNGVTAIHGQLLSYCKKLVKITLGKNINYIDSKAFSDSYLLTDIYSYAEVPPTLSYDKNVFSNFLQKQNCALWVLPGSATYYKDSDDWADFNIIEMNDEMVGINDILINPTTSNIIYDLNGHRLNTAPAKGLYIHNGKKFMNK